MKPGSDGGGNGMNCVHGGPGHPRQVKRLVDSHRCAARTICANDNRPVGHSHPLPPKPKVLVSEQCTYRPDLPQSGKLHQIY
jgi:hypothetical protein